MNIEICRQCFEQRRRDADMSQPLPVLRVDHIPFTQCCFGKMQRQYMGNEVHGQGNGGYIDVVPRELRLRDLEKA